MTSYFWSCKVPTNSIWIIFSFLLEHISSYLRGFKFSFCLSCPVVFFVLFSMPRMEFLFFFRLKSSNSFSVKLIFGRSFIFWSFVRNQEPLIFRQHEVALSASVTLSWPTKATKKLNRSGLDFLVLVWQSWNSFNLNAFFQFCFSLFLLATCFMFSFCLCGLVVPLFCSPYQDWMFWFFWSVIFRWLLDETHVFGRSLFFVFVFIDGALNLLQHVVQLSLSVTMWRAAGTK